MASDQDYLLKIERLKTELSQIDTVLIGAGAGLSTSAGFTYAGERFERNFSDFIAKYHFTDMYTAGFYQFSTLEEHWAYWSRQIYWNRYVPAPKPVYNDLLKLMENKDYFVLSTNVDHQFQKTGFEKRRLFYTQGDYGLWQCSVPCHQKTYDNEETVQQMITQQHDMHIPSELVPYCPVCGKPMTMNLRADETFVEDSGWQAASANYSAFLQAHRNARILFLELGVGENTPGIIKYPFWRMTANNPQATYISINLGEAYVPQEIADRAICINADIGDTLHFLKQV